MASNGDLFCERLAISGSAPDSLLRRMLGFLHTAPIQVGSFTRIVQELNADVPVQHAVREDLLTQAIADGAVTERTRQETQAEVTRLVDGGARVVLCTCSTLGDAAEAYDSSAARVLRVDRPMAEQAVALGRPILVVAATPTAMETAVALVRSASAPEEARLRELMCGAAWERFLAGDQAGYATSLAEQVDEHARAGEVVMLAQASMLRAAALIRRTDVEVLTSPELGVRRALAWLSQE